MKFDILHKFWLTNHMDTYTHSYFSYLFSDYYFSYFTITTFKVPSVL